jgi:hypothetical protein
MKSIVQLSGIYYFVISGFRRGLNEVFALLGCYAAQIDS